MVLRFGMTGAGAAVPARPGARAELERIAGTAGIRPGAGHWNGPAMRFLIRFFGFLFAAGTLVFLVAVGAVSGLLYHFSKDLPDYSQLQDYEPPVMTRVHAANGELLAEYA